MLARVIVGVTVCAIVISACDDNDPFQDRNLPPETYLLDAPGYADAGFYVNHIYWNGFDPDGTVDHFEIAITDSAGTFSATVLWRATTRTDSLVRFPVDAARTGRRFYVRAVDMLGIADPDPAWTLFLPEDPQAPLVTFTTAEGGSDSWPNPDEPAVISLTPPADCDAGFPPDSLPAGSRARFEWTAVDPDSLFGVDIADIAGYEFRHLPRDDDFQGGTLHDTAVTLENLEPGPHTFTVRAMNDAGFVGEACRYFHVNLDPECVLYPMIDLCTGEEVMAFKLSRYYTPHSVPQPWSPEAVGLPSLEQSPCLPAGYFASNDTLPAGDRGQSWWLTVEPSCIDPDGTLDRIEMFPMRCWREDDGEKVCRGSLWGETVAVPDEPGTFVIGPIPPGDTRIRFAGVDDLDQRGSTGTTEIDLYVDRAPRLIHSREPNGECVRLGGQVGEQVSVCDWPEPLHVTNVQSRGLVETPCAVTTSFLSGEPAPFGVAQYGSLPLPGEHYEVEFVEEHRPGIGTVWVGELPALLWMEDDDSNRRVERIRWRLDAPPTSEVFEVATNDISPGLAGERTPACFPLVVEHGEPFQLSVSHVLYVEIMDHDRGFGDAFPGAERIGRAAIPFFVSDITKP